MPDLIAEINAYLDDPTPEGVQALARRGEVIVEVGLEVIADRLRRIAFNPMFIMNEGLGDELVMREGIKGLAVFQDVILATGQAGFNRLLLLVKHKYPSVRKLAALELASNDLAKPAAREPLTRAFQLAEDTGMKLACAIALAAQKEHDLRPLKSLAIPYLATPEHFSFMCDMLLEEAPKGTKREEVEELLYLHLAFTNGPRLLALDVGSNGLAPQSLWSSWVRETASEHFPYRSENWEQNRAFPILKRLFPYNSASFDELLSINPNKQELIEDLQYLIDQDYIETVGGESSISIDSSFVFTFYGRNYWCAWWKEIPSDKLNLEELAWDYLTAPKLYRAEQQEVLVEKGADSVFPLLRAGYKLLTKNSKEYYQPLVRKARASTLGAEFGYKVSIEVYGKDIIQDVYEIISALGQPGWDAMCRALREDTDGMKTLAALILFENENPSSRTINAITDIISLEQLESYGSSGGKSEKPAEWEVAATLLTVVVARGEEVEFKRALASIVNKRGTTPEKFSEEAQTFAYIYLFETLGA